MDGLTWGNNREALIRTRIVGTEMLTGRFIVEVSEPEWTGHEWIVYWRLSKLKAVESVSIWENL